VPYKACESIHCLTQSCVALLCAWAEKGDRPDRPDRNNAAFNASKEPSWLFNKTKSHLLSVACIVRTMRSMCLVSLSSQPLAKRTCATTLAPMVFIVADKF
jgi:hypothetical protein